MGDMKVVVEQYNPQLHFNTKKSKENWKRFSKTSGI